MLIEAGELPSGSTLNAEICIIGGGVAGITLALEFERQGITTCVLEGGGLKPTTKSQSLYQGDNVGLPYDLQATRTRRLGGSSNCWGGWIRPFIDIDFEERDWIPNSGWPFGLEEVEPYYRRASDLVQVNHHGFDPEFWHSRLSERAHLLDHDREALDTVVSKFSPPTRFGRDYHKELTAARSAKVILNANVVQLDTCSNATTVKGVRVLSAGGSEFFVRAKHTILAAGGIENARLMLLSNSVDARGLGNQHDLVGRYFMEHPRIRLGRLIPAKGADGFRFYDARYTFHNPRLSVEGTSASAHLALSEEVQRREKLLQCRTYFRACRAAEDNAHTEQFHELFNAVRWGHYGDIKLKTFAAVVRNSPSLLTSLMYRRLKLTSQSDHFLVETVLEPAPDPESRVTLSSQRDRLGCQRAHLDWRMGDLEKRTHLRMLEIIRDDFERSGLGRIDLEGADQGRSLPVIGCCHHMGTTRMHVDPRQGVVDSNCKVHGMHNLHIAGSSLFPTSGNDMPTLTVVALALRLADHIKAQYGVSSHTAPATEARHLQRSGDAPWEPTEQAARAMTN